MFVLPVFAAGDIRGMCDLIEEMQGIFKQVRTLAFVGAGFMLAKYAWAAISTGKLNGEADLVKGGTKNGYPNAGWADLVICDWYGVAGSKFCHRGAAVGVHGGNIPGLVKKYRGQK